MGGSANDVRPAPVSGGRRPWVERPQPGASKSGPGPASAAARYGRLAPHMTAGAPASGAFAQPDPAPDPASAAALAASLGVADEGDVFGRFYATVKDLMVGRARGRHRLGGDRRLPMDAHHLALRR